MSNNFFTQEENEEFRDIPEEVSGGNAEIPQVRVNRPSIPAASPTQSPPQAPVIIQEYYGPDLNEDSEEDFSSVLTDARFRLEQGRLYEMIMNHNIFDGADADEKAIKYVTKQIRNFAKEQMEIMLGMRQEVSKSQALSAEDFPFNDLEVQTLKALASAATKGATASPEAQQFSGVQAIEPRRVGLNTIGVKPQKATQKIQQSTQQPKKPLAQKAAVPVQRNQRTEAQIEQILREEGISREVYERQYNPNYIPLSKPLSQMSESELQEWKRQDALKTNKQVKNSSAIPMPSIEQEEALYSTRVPSSASLNANIVNLLLKQKQ